jgi:hypothetical protein
VSAPGAVWALPLASTPSPSGTTTGSPTPNPDIAPDPNSVTPGLAGFLVVFILAIVTFFLVRNMTGRLRRMRFRENERLAVEQAQQDAQPADPGAAASKQD